MSQTVEHLEKVLGDLVGNRQRLVEQIGIQHQQIEVNQTQVGHFDTLIATTRVALGDLNLIGKIDELLAAPPQEPAQLPLGIAGAGASDAPAPAGQDGANGAG